MTGALGLLARELDAPAIQLKTAGYRVALTPAGDWSTRGADERGEQRVRLEGLRFELGVKLHADEPRVVGNSTISGSKPSGDMPENRSPAASSVSLDSRC